MRTNGAGRSRIDHDRGRFVEADAQIEVYSIHIPVCTNRNPLAVVSTIISWTVNLEIAKWRAVKMV